MLTPKQFKAIDINSMIEVGTVFEGLSDEKIAWVCQERCKHPKRGTEVAVFGLFYMDISIGRMRGELLKNNTIDWKDLA